MCRRGLRHHGINDKPGLFVGKAQSHRLGFTRYCKQKRQHFRAAFSGSHFFKFVNKGHFFRVNIRDVFHVNLHSALCAINLICSIKMINLIGLSHFGVLLRDCRYFRKKCYQFPEGSCYTFPSVQSSSFPLIILQARN